MLRGNSFSIGSAVQWIENWAEMHRKCFFCPVRFRFESDFEFDYNCWFECRRNWHSNWIWMEKMDDFIPFNLGRHWITRNYCQIPVEFASASLRPKFNERCYQFLAELTVEFGWISYCYSNPESEWPRQWRWRRRNKKPVGVALPVTTATEKKSRAEQKCKATKQMKDEKKKKKKKRGTMDELCVCWLNRLRLLCPEAIAKTRVAC